MAPARRKVGAKPEYERLKVLGEGTYGKVYMCRHIASGKLVAMKHMKRFRGELGLSASTLREISLLRELSSPYVVKLLDVSYKCSESETKDSETVAVFEYMNSDLRRHIHEAYLGKDQLVPPDVTRHFAYQILLGMQHCHSNSIMHRDLKPANILYDRTTNTLKIADFGLGRGFDAVHSRYTREVQTLDYRAPEVLLGTKKYTHLVDLWSIGCIFGELLLGQCLFAGNCELEVLFSIFKTLGTPSCESWPGHMALPYWHIFPKWRAKPLKTAFQWAIVPDDDALDLLGKLLTCCPEKRLSAMQAIQHAYFDKIRASYPTPVGARLLDLENSIAAMDVGKESESKQNGGMATKDTKTRRRVGLRDRSTKDVPPG